MLNHAKKFFFRIGEILLLTSFFPKPIHTSQSLIFHVVFQFLILLYCQSYPKQILLEDISPIFSTSLLEYLFCLQPNILIFHSSMQRCRIRQKKLLNSTSVSIFSFSTRNQILLIFDLHLMGIELEFCMGTNRKHEEQF